MQRSVASTLSAPPTRSNGLAGVIVPGRVRIAAKPGC